MAETVTTSALRKVQNAEEKHIYFDKYTQKSTCLRYGLGRRTHGGTRDTAVSYTSGAEGATRQHRLLIRSQEKKTGWGEEGEKDAVGFMAWRICLFWVLSSNFASLVAMAAQSGLHAASIGASRAEHRVELVQRWPGTAGAQAGCQRQLETCSKPQGRARSKPGALAQGSDPACKQGHTPSPAQQLFGHRFLQDPAGSCALLHHPANALPALQPGTALLNPINGSGYRKISAFPFPPRADTCQGGDPGIAFSSTSSSQCR